MKNYFDTPEAAVAINFKVGSSTLARSIIATHHSAIDSLLTTPHGNGNGTAYPAGKTANSSRWHGLCPKVSPHERPVTLLAVREPVDHFRSACAESNITDIDSLLTSLETTGQGRDPHFWPQSRLVQGNSVKLYRFPQDLDALALEAGLTLPLLNIDGGHSHPKPTLTPEQEARVLAVYAADATLYASITEAGQVFVPEPVPESVPDADTRAWLLFLDGVITDPVTGIALKANRNARNDFIGQATLIREALDAGSITSASLMSIWDAENNEHALTVAELRALLLRYGFAWQTAFNQLAP